MTHEELIEALKEQTIDLPDDCSRYMDFALRKSDIEMLIAALEAEPVKHEHWEIAIGYDPNRSFQCSGCGKMAFENSRFCPDCGTKMDELFEKTEKVEV